MLAGPDEGEK